MAKINSMRSADAALGAAAPRYVTSKATKRAYAALKKAYQNDKGVGNTLKQLESMGDYNPAKSAYYQKAYHSLKNAYTNQGKLDMQNAAAAAASNTGGFGNSYGASSGAQAYQARLAQLAAKVPEIYSAGASEFAARKNELANMASMRQAQQEAAIAQAQFKLGVQQQLDKERYEAAKYADSVNRDNARLWWTNYLARL